MSKSKKKSYEELIKDFATDDDLAAFSKEFVQKCRRMYCTGIACVSAPQSEIAHIAISSDFYTAHFLLKSLAEKIAQAANLSPTLLAANMMWYLAQTETGAILEEEKIIKKSLVGKAEEFAFWNLKDVIYRSQHAEWLEGTPIASRITVID